MLLQYITWDPSPYILEFGGFALRWYSMLFATGFVVAFVLLRRIFLQENVPLKILDQMLMYSVVGAILGARIGNCVFYNWDYFSTRPLEIILPFSFEPEFRFTGYRGLASHGGILGLALAYWILSIRTKRPFLWFMDRLAAVGVFGLASIRLGNLMNSEILGNATDLPWAFVFVQHDQIPRHPVQIYGAITYLLLFAFMLWYYHQKKGKVKDGHIFGIGIMLVGILRFGLEFLKSHYVFDAASPLNMAQLLSLPLIVLGAWLAWQRRVLDKA